MSEDANRIRGEDTNTGHYWLPLADDYDLQGFPYCMYVACVRCDVLACDHKYRGCDERVVNSQCENPDGIVDGTDHVVYLDYQVRFRYQTNDYGYSEGWRHVV